MPAARASGSALLLASSFALACTPASPPPRLGRLPSFALVERHGGKVDLARLQGRPWVADFIFTTCAGACPAMTARMARLRKEIAPEVRFVSFTVDPVHDTPEALKRYASAFGADGDWLFVTGPKTELYRLSTEGFKLAAMEVPEGERQGEGDGPFLHSSKFVLVDGGGEVRGYYDSTDEAAMRTLVADAARL